MELFKFFLLFFMFTSSLLYAQYPEIYEFDRLRDVQYKALQEDIERTAPLLARWESRKGDPELKETIISQIRFFQYRVREGESLFTIAADLMLNTDSLSSLNGIENSLFIEPGSLLVIPNQPGLFQRIPPVNGLDRTINEAPRNPQYGLPLMIYQQNELFDYLFFPAERFSRTERLFFISRPFDSPLDVFQMGSGFGNREDPFTGRWVMHNGIDLNVPKGTPVFAIKDGIIQTTGLLDNYGLYIIINHEGGYSSLYGHLDQILVIEGDSVHKGQEIGLSGNTGRSTGPHLHLEVLKENVPVDPVALIRSP